MTDGVAASAAKRLLMEWAFSVRSGRQPDYKFFMEP